MQVLPFSHVWDARRGDTRIICVQYAEVLEVDGVINILDV